MTAEAFAHSVAQTYEAATGLTPAIYLSRATDGASVVEQH